MSPPIILLTIDALNEEQFDSQRFPKSQEYFADFAAFENAYSHGVATPFAFPGIITGELAANNGELSAESETIAELLRSHRSAAFSNNPHLIPSKGYKRGFDSFHHAAPPDNKGAEVLIDRIKRFGRRLPISDQLYRLKTTLGENLVKGGLASPPYSNAKDVAKFVVRQFEQAKSEFVWGHFMDPHFPFNPDAMVSDSTQIPDSEEINWVEDNFINNSGTVNFSLIKTLYDINVRYMDEHFHNLFSQLDQLGIYEDAMIVVTADHGELFGEHGRTAHPWDSDPYDELIQVPLLVKYPNNRNSGRSYQHIVSHQNIGATILKELSYTNSDWGRSLRDTSQRYPISVSNAAVRITGPEGYIIKRRGGNTKKYHTVTSEMEDGIEDVEFPEIPHLSGEIEGLEERDTQDMEQRLKDLGYK